MHRADLGFVAALLGIVASIPYIRSTWRGNTVPHVITFFVWAVVTAILLVGQIHGGAGWRGYLLSALSTFFTFITFALSLRNGTRYITRFDVACLILICVTGIAWAATSDITVAVVLAVVVDVFAYMPTIRKGWVLPNEEKLQLFIVMSVARGLSIAALARFSINTLLFPVEIVIANSVLIGVVTYRRRILDTGDGR